MKKTTVKVVIVTFFHKERNNPDFFENSTAPVSVVGDEDCLANSYEGEIFGHYYNSSGLWKVVKAVEKLGHTVVTNEREIEIHDN